MTTEGGGRRRTRRSRRGAGAGGAAAFLEASARRPQNPRDTDCILTAASCSAFVAFAAAVARLICRSSAATRSRSAAFSASSIFGLAAAAGVAAAAGAAAAGRCRPKEICLASFGARRVLELCAMELQRDDSECSMPTKRSSSSKIWMSSCARTKGVGVGVAAQGHD